MNEIIELSAKETERMIKPTEDINSRYLAYCKTHNLTYEEMMQFDEERYPGGRMAGFILWLQTNLKIWTEEMSIKTDHYSTQHLVEFDKWLMKRIEQ